MPVKKPRNGELDINTKTRNMLLRGARHQGERAFALMSQRWRAIRHVSADPSQIGDIAKSVHPPRDRSPTPGAQDPPHGRHADAVPEPA